MPKISIIVPVYNVEKYLHDCIDSIINQTFKDIEIICVNDGSTDRSLEVLNKFAQKDSRVKVISQVNQGVSVARNTGIDNAQGEIIMFCDSDDKYDLSLCQKVVEKFEQTDADIVGYAHHDVYSDYIDEENLKIFKKLAQGKLKLKRIIGFQIFIWDKAFKKELLNKNNIRFKEGLKCAEDLVFCFLTFFTNPKYALIPECLYFYTKERDGNTVTNNENGIKNDLISLKYLTSTPQFKHQSKKMKRYVVNRFIGGSRAYYRQFQNTEKQPVLLNDVKSVISYVASIFPRSERNKMKNYVKLKKIVWKAEKHWYFNLFDIETTKDTKTYTIFGLKFTFQRKGKFFFKFIFSLKNSQDPIYKILTILGIKIKLKKCKIDYQNALKKIKKKDKIRVCFLVNEVSKWKTQSLYDLMEKSNLFEPFIALTIADRQWNFTDTEKQNILKANFEYFKNRGMKVFYAYDFELNYPKKLNFLTPDIIFYQQPWQINNLQSIRKVFKFALTCYVPYFIPNYGILSMDCQYFHSCLFRYYVLNKDWENIYKDYMKNPRINLVTVGHTMLDYFYLNAAPTDSKNYVIYAPHWSIHHEKNKNDQDYATFLFNGKVILNYAKQHPEINWAFKPHPTLKTVLKAIGWSKEEIDEYYNEWEKIGKCCYDGDYMELFAQSKAIITDCGSFLIEYFCTGKPVLHLISPYCKVPVPEPTQKILDTFYKINDENDLYKYLDDVVLKDNDYKKEERELKLKESGLLNNYAAQNIIDDLTKVIKG